MPSNMLLNVSPEPPPHSETLNTRQRLHLRSYTQARYLPNVTPEPEPLNIGQIFEDRRLEAELLQVIAEPVDPPPSWNRQAGRVSCAELLEGEDNTETNPPSYT
jgi:hypothetical protein